ncbi:MAG: pseudouridine synthase [Thermoplasmata archaeon]|nr:pseudouridine synthase [Thermoplasmata archaeon]
MDEGIRLNKYLAEAGIASRRGSDRLIEEGRVTVNGEEATLGTKVMPGDTVKVDGKAVKADTGGTVILAFNKPRGITCTANKDDPDNIIDYIGYPRRIFTVGRLDKDSEGLILLTNDGALADRIMRSRYGHEKEYIVTVDRDVEKDFLDRMESGVEIEEGVVTRRCRTELIDPRRFRIILRQGLNRQIRRMCEVLGYNVVRLQRIRVMNIQLGKLREGSYRDLSKAERQELMELVEASRLAPKE